MATNWETCPVCYGGDASCPDNCNPETEPTVTINRRLLVWALGRTDVDPRGKFYSRSRIRDGEKRLAQLLKERR